jgi:brefeldin A-resistance guanine nucleotide exchange factor 1
MLEKFRLPGEAQQIQRVVEAFAGGFYDRVVASEVEEYKRTEAIAVVPAATEDGVKPPPKEAPPLSKDAVFVLAYAVIMLNTDQHNPQVRRRMAIDDFARNLRGTNDSVNFQRSYLEAIYNAIKDREVIMPEEHGDTEVGFEYRWRETMKRNVSALASEELNLIRDRPLDSLSSLDAHTIVAWDREMFGLSWKPLSTAILYGTIQSFACRLIFFCSIQFVRIAGGVAKSRGGDAPTL